MQIGLANFQSPFRANQLIVNLLNGQTANINLYPGVYATLAQGGGGSGGTYGDFGWGRGSGGGSGAGFNGWLRLKRTLINHGLQTGVAVASGKWSVNGNGSSINGILDFGGGEGGITNEALAVGGTLTRHTNDEVFDFPKINYLGNGYGTRVIDDNKRYGANSVVTNDGGGNPSENATNYGAGGGGYTGNGINGGAGGGGQITMTYINQYI